MISVYVGNINKIQINGTVYDKGTPTYIAPPSRGDIAKRDDFEVYNPEKDYPDGKRAIYVNMPADFTLFIAAINVVKEIKSLFPKSPIHATCDANWAFLLDGIANCSQALSTNGSNDFYRRYDLHIKKRNIPIELSRWQSHGYEQILLEKILLFEVNKHKNYIPPKLGINKRENNVVVFHSGDDPTTTWKELSVNLLKNDNYKHISKTKYDSESLKSYIKLLESASYVVVCGDSPIAALVAYSGCNCSIIADNSKYDKFSRFRKLGAKGGAFGNKPSLDQMIKSLENNIPKNNNSVPIMTGSNVTIDMSSEPENTEYIPDRKKKKKNKGE